MGSKLAVPPETSTSTLLADEMAARIGSGMLHIAIQSMSNGSGALPLSASRMASSGGWPSTVTTVAPGRTPMSAATLPGATDSTT